MAVRQHCGLSWLKEEFELYLPCWCFLTAPVPGLWSREWMSVLCAYSVVWRKSQSQACPEAGSLYSHLCHSNLHKTDLWPYINVILFKILPTFLGISPSLSYFLVSIEFDCNFRILCKTLLKYHLCGQICLIHKQNNYYKWWQNSQKCYDKSLFNLIIP